MSIQWQVPVGTIFWDPTPEREVDRGRDLVAVTEVRNGSGRYVPVDPGWDHAGRVELRKLDLDLARRLVVRSTPGEVVRPAAEPGFRLGTVVGSDPDRTGYSRLYQLQEIDSDGRRGWTPRPEVGSVGERYRPDDGYVRTGLAQGWLHLLSGGYVEAD